MLILVEHVDVNLVCFFIGRALKGKLSNTVNGWTVAWRARVWLCYSSTTRQQTLYFRSSSQTREQEGRRKNRLVVLEFKLWIESLLHFQNRHNYKLFAFNSKIQNLNITFTMSILFIFQCFVCFTPGFFRLWGNMAYYLTTREQDSAS